MKKKVLIVTQNFYPVIGSAGNRMKNIYQLLNNNDIEAHVITIEPSYPNKNMYKDRKFWDDEEINNNENNNIEWIKLRSSNSLNMFNRLLFYIEIMFRYFGAIVKRRREKYDYVLVSTPPIFIVLSVMLGNIFLRSKIILEVRDLWPDSLLGVRKFNNRFIIKCLRVFERSMYRKANKIIINSSGFKQHITDHLKGKDKEIVYIPNGPRRNEIVTTKETNTEFSVVYTGNLGLAQDIEKIKEIAIHLDAANITFNVMCYGMMRKEFIEFVHVNKLDHVNILEAGTRQESLDLIQKSSIALALLNEADAFATVLPGKIIDYITCSTPVVAVVKGVSANIINKNNIGKAFDDGNVTSLINYIKSLKNDEQAIKELGENCLKTINEYFVWENNIEKLIKIIE